MNPERTGSFRPPKPIMTDIQRSAIRKTAWRFVPLVTVAYLFNYLDRTCIGFAALTMKADIGLSNEQLGIGAGIFFLGYSFFEVPSNLAMYRFGARRWIARIMISWGLLSTAMVLITGPYSFYLMRFLLGVAEAGFFPGVTFFIAAWFPAQVRTQMLAWFLVGIPLSSVIGGPLCGLLLQMDGVWSLAGWQWLFIAVSLPCVPIGLLVLGLLADGPQQAEFLSAAEKDAMVAMISAEVRERARHSMASALSDLRVWILAGVQFGFTLGSYGVIIWLPLIMKEYGLSNSAVGWLSAVPYLFATAGMLAWAWYVDRTGHRVGPLTLTCFLAAAGLAISVTPDSFLIAMSGMTLALIGVTSARAVFWTIPTRFLTGVAAAGGLAFINMIGTTGGFVGPYMMGWLRDTTQSFTAGLLAMAVILLGATAMAWSLRFVMTRE
jgi:MFS family permease